MTSWAAIIYGPEAAEQMEEAMGRAIDQAMFHTTQPIQENEMNERQITEVSATVDAGLSQEDLDDMNEAERLALVVGSAYGRALAERDDCRAVNRALLEQLSTATELLEKAYPILDASTWAADSRLADSIQAFLQDVDSEQAPTQEDTPDAT